MQADKPLGLRDVYQIPLNVLDDIRWSHRTLLRSGAREEHDAKHTENQPFWRARFNASSDSCKLPPVMIIDLTPTRCDRSSITSRSSLDGTISIYYGIVLRCHVEFNGHAFMFSLATIDASKNRIGKIHWQRDQYGSLGRNIARIRLIPPMSTMKESRAMTR